MHLNSSLKEKFHNKVLMLHLTLSHRLCYFPFFYISFCFFNAVHDPLNWFHNLQFEKLLWVISSTLLASSPISVLMTFPYVSLSPPSPEAQTLQLSTWPLHVDVTRNLRVNVSRKAPVVPSAPPLPALSLSTDGARVQAAWAWCRRLTGSGALGSYWTSFCLAVFILIEPGFQLYLFLGLL